jgi:hypothetical protein
MTKIDHRDNSTDVLQPWLISSLGSQEGMNNDTASDS